MSSSMVSLTEQRGALHDVLLLCLHRLHHRRLRCVETRAPPRRLGRENFPGSIHVQDNELSNGPRARCTCVETDAQPRRLGQKLSSFDSCARPLADESSLQADIIRCFGPSVGFGASSAAVLLDGVHCPCRREHVSLPTRRSNTLSRRISADIHFPSLSMGQETSSRFASRSGYLISQSTCVVCFCFDAYSDRCESRST